jgi:hypothetical protein
MRSAACASGLAPGLTQMARKLSVVAMQVSPGRCLRGAGGCESLRRVPDEPVPDDAAGLRAANARLHAVVEAKDGQVAMLTAALDAILRFAAMPDLGAVYLPGLSGGACLTGKQDVTSHTKAFE